MTASRLTPPPVHCQCGRPQAVARALLAVWLGVGGLLMAWWLSAPFGGQQGLGVSLWIVSGLWCRTAWRAGLLSRLHWDGHVWSMEWPSLAPEEGELFCHLDAQSWMLLLWQPKDGPVRWLTACVQDQPERWHAVRCAVHARPRRARDRVPSDGATVASGGSR